MSETLFILGREPELSVAELEAASPRWRARVVDVGREYAVLDHATPLPERAIDQLGGCLKQVRILERWPIRGSAVEVLSENITVPWIIDHAPADLRIVFGVSVYGLSRSATAAMRRHSLQLKKELKASGRPARMVVDREPQLTTVTVQRQGLINHGREFVAVVSGETALMGVTEHVQDYRAYSLRDFGRPAADAKSGMVPPKLAQMMLNIAQVEPTDVLLDPFCGSGTVLQEAAMLGVKKMFGSDTEVKAVKAAQENLRWMLKEFPHVQTDVEIVQGDARHVSVRADAVVTEPYLGKPLYGNEPATFLERQAQELNDLYLAAFKRWATVLKTGARVVMIWPEFSDRTSTIAIDLTADVQRLRFEPRSLLSPMAAKALNAADPFVLKYAREEARVTRQIRKWVKG